MLWLDVDSATLMPNDRRRCGDMEVTTLDYVRPLDFSKFDPARFTVQTLAGRENGSERCLFRVGRVPTGNATETSHIHSVDKFYYVLAGEMTVQIEDEVHRAGPNTLIFVPAGVPHRNWNEREEPELHIVLFVPEPPPGAPLTLPVPGQTS